MADLQQKQAEQKELTRSAEVLVGISDKGWTPWQLVVDGQSYDAFITARNADANQILFAVSEYVVALETLKKEKLFIPNPSPRPVYTQRGQGGGNSERRKQATPATNYPAWVSPSEGETVYRLGHIQPFLSAEMKTNGIGESKVVPFAYYDMEGGYIVTDRLPTQTGTTKFPAATTEFLRMWDELAGVHAFRQYSKIVSEWLNAPSETTATALSTLELVVKEQEIYVLTKKGGQDGKYTNLSRFVADPKLVLPI